MKRCYDLPLIDWINKGLRRSTLEATMQAIRNNSKLDDVPVPRTTSEYIQKIFRNKVFRQFEDDEESLVQLIKNSLDARPDGVQDYLVDVKVRDTLAKVADKGKGMGLEDILVLLTMPFSTTKAGVDELGIHGVGFGASFKQCVNYPQRTKIFADTGNGKEAYHLMFYAVGGGISDLRMRLKRARKMQGTTVDIKGVLPDKKDLIKYITEALNGVPTHRGKIAVNRGIINEDSEHDWYSAPGNFVIGQKQRQQLVGFRRSDEYVIRLNSQGALVKKVLVEEQIPGAVISFPSAVGVVQGWNGFRKDENYDIAIAAVFNAFAEYVYSQTRDSEFISEITDFLPILASVFDIQKLSDIPNISNIQEKLLPGREYVLRELEYGDLAPFFEGVIDEKAFVASPQSYSYWNELYSGKSELVKNMVNPIRTLKPRDFRYNVSEWYPNLQILSENTTQETMVFPSKRDPYTRISSQYKSFCFVSGPQDSECPFYIDLEQKILYINVNHPYVEGPLNANKAYGLMSEYFSLRQAQKIADMGPESVEFRIGRLSQHFGVEPVKEAK